MRFSAKIEEEILKSECRKKEHSLALILGIAAFTMRETEGGIKFTTNGESVAKRLSYMLKRQLEIEDGVISLAGSGRGGVCRDLSYDGKSAEIIKNALLKENGDEIKVDELKDLETLRYFVMGAFLGGGFMVDPEKMYHLEFASKRDKAPEEIGFALDKFGEIPKKVMRDKYHIMYFKSYDSIENILNIIGAHKCMMELANIKIEKEAKNELNRKVNFEVANIKKTTDAANESIKEIENIMYTVGLDALPDELQEMALLRLANPEESLSQLSKLSGLSRSGVNHRLQKISRIAREL